MTSGETVDRIAEEGAWISEVMTEVRRVVVGQDHLLERILIGFLANGHVLLEGLPGLAKSLTVQALATAMGGDFHRIQFTPDLLPSDLLGTQIYNPQSGEWSTRLGPLFANIVLADEINRAPAKVQSALLEAMQERMISIAGESHRLPDPFLVLATQNPIDQGGTYPLPEAQVDRFLFKVVVDYPDQESEKEIVRRMARNEGRPEPRCVASPEKLLSARRTVDAVHVDEKIIDYVINLVAATRDADAAGIKDVSALILHGASPRASIALTQAARAHAFLDGRAFVMPQDVKAIGPDVLRHRLVLSYEAEAADVSVIEILDRVFDAIPIP